jgi:hypothetical protein
MLVTGLWLQLGVMRTGMLDSIDGCCTLQGHYSCGHDLTMQCAWGLNVPLDICRSDSTLLRLVKDYPRSAPPSERCAFIAQELGLEGPTDPDKLFAVGQYMPCERDMCCV